MRRWTLVFWLFTAAASAADDPPGTQAVDLGVGKTHRIEAPPGSNVLCDDPAVAVGEFTDDGNAYQLRGVKPGVTLCGVWLGNMKPGGLFRVTVHKPLETPSPDGGG
jgi:hypothetical protein